MSILAAPKGKSFNLAGRITDRQSLLLFSATLLLSASLLFSVQPLFAKLVLPYLGGSSSVWAVAMCFFQAALLAGYCYAHALNRFVPAQWTPLIHLTVCCAAMLALPFGLPAWAATVPEGNTYLWLVGVLTVGVGLPFFAVSANAPLLQAWFAKTGHPHADDPYFLYGASNLGSLASLLAYPFLIEPMLGLDTQTSVWTWGFYGLTILLVACGALMMAARATQVTEKTAPEARAQTTAIKAQPVGAQTRLIWIGLALIPSALLVAFTTHITTDIASAPFLWVIPLATFLGTFVLVFRDKPMIPHGRVLQLHPYLVALALLFIVMPNIASVAVQGVVGFVTFVVTTLVCHRALYEERPSADRLTEFYLYMSLGGVLGGIFAALLAPQLFTSVAEYPLLIVAGLFARPQVCATFFKPDHRTNIALIGGLVLAAIIVVTIANAHGVITNAQTTSLVGLASLAMVALITVFASKPEMVAKLAVGAATIFVAMSGLSFEGYSERSFFGVSRVIDTEDNRYRLLIHGSTLHGGEKLLDAAGKQPVTPPPILYYHPGSPLARGFDVARSADTNNGKPMHVGVIGLGTGSLACHLKGNETIAFHEIDPVVIKIARDPNHFRYLSTCAPETPIVLGDARLTLGDAPDHSFDYFVVDAFSSDAVPVHLLTQEALEIYLSKTKDTALIAMHISNKHLELESVIAATVNKIGGIYAASVLEAKGLPGHEGNPSHVVFISKNKALIDQITTWPDAEVADARQTQAWSDNYADIISALWRRYTGKAFP